jgi:hypothetical protein
MTVKGTEVPRCLLIIVLAFALSGCTSTKRDWERAVDSNSIGGYESYISEYPDGDHTAEAKQRLAHLKTKREEDRRRTEEERRRAEEELRQAWQSAQATNTPDGYLEFYKNHEDSAQANEAADAYWRLKGIQLVEQTPTVTAIRVRPGNELNAMAWLAMMDNAEAILDGLGPHSVNSYSGVVTDTTGAPVVGSTAKIIKSHWMDNYEGSCGISKPDDQTYNQVQLLILRHPKYSFGAVDTRIGKVAANGKSLDGEKRKIEFNGDGAVCMIRPSEMRVYIFSEEAPPLLTESANRSVQ